MPHLTPPPSRFHSWLQRGPEYDAFLVAAGCGTLAACAEAGRQRGQEVARGNHVRVWRTPLLAGSRCETLYIKRYVYDDMPWRYWGRSSRAWNEIRNYWVFEDLGIPGPTVVVGGETRSWRGLQEALVVTREIPRCRNLADLVADPAFAHDAAVRRRILTLLGLYAARAHRRSFFHRDLKLRNLLVQDFPAPDCGVYWIDCPRGGVHLLRRARLAAADLAGMEPLQHVLRPGEWTELLTAYATTLRGEAPLPMLGAPGPPARGDPAAAPASGCGGPSVRLH